MMKVFPQCFVLPQFAGQANSLRVGWGEEGEYVREPALVVFPSTALKRITAREEEGKKKRNRGEGRRNRIRNDSKAGCSLSIFDVKLGRQKAAREVFESH